ncbi:hypothetical protein [Bacillus arachidis]|uniref:hypothetical protein n=1 Tax=Bacillus arachidis TaxID=2819290 RepID=UPI00255CCF15|nr:hypothetical protein [Bacillus arachidis]WIY63172.1 hypothetical protein QRY57_12235 [Bacillus arachidis]
MRKELLEIYTNFSNEKLETFFDDLIGIVIQNQEIFSKYLTIDFFNEIIKYKSTDFIIGHSDDLFSKGVDYYKKNIGTFSEEQLVRQVATLIWGLSAYMSDKLCPNCQQSNMRLLMSENRSDIYEFCEECLFTILDGNPVNVDEELFPAKKQEVIQCLNKINEKL